MLSRNLIAIGIAATAAYYLAEKSQIDGIIAFYRETLSGPMFAYWFAGFVAATISAPACTFLFWSIAKRRRRGWVLHLLLVPTIYALVQACSALMLFASGEPDLDSLTGYSLVPAMLLVVICPIGYFLSLTAQSIRRHRRSANAG